MHKILVAAVAACLVVVVLFSGCGGTTTGSSEASAGTDATTAPAGTAAADSQGGQLTGDPIVIGAVVSTTGPNAPLGEPERMALELFEKQINAAGGVLGRPLDVVVLDDQSNAKEAVTATQRLLQQEKAVAVIGASGSASTLAMKAITAQAGIPQIAMAASNNITSEPPSDWIWRVAPKDDLAVERAVSHVAEGLRVTKIAVLYDENAFGSSGLAQIEKVKDRYGIEVVAKESYKTDETDLTAQLTKLKGSNPEALIVWGTNPGPAVAAKNLKQLAWDIPYVGSHGIANAKFIELAGEAAEGVTFPTTKILFPESITDPEQKALIEKLITDYTAEFGQAPNHFSSHGWDGIAVLVAAIEQAKSTEPAALQAALNGLTDFTGADGIFTYTATDHDGLKVDDLIMVRVEGGKWALAQ
ncbi:MAG: ABC transporter substrate-binding protein [Gaiellales bacterium]|nr:ABC transporter substrate-binding protein [Gaiellales bacterium]